MQAALKRDKTYDFVTTKSRTRTSVRREETRTRAPSISGFTVFAYLVCFALLLVTIFSYVKLTEVSDQTVRLKNQLEDLREKNQSLAISVEQRLSADQIKREATERLGMVALDKSQVVYINTQGNDQVEVLSGTQTMRDRSAVIAGLARGFQLFVEYLN